MDLNEPEDVRALLLKLWAHGQAVAPVQGVAYAFWAITKASELSSLFKIILWVAALKFPVWCYVSWHALKLQYGENSYYVIASFGSVIVLFDIFIAVFAVFSGELNEAWPLLAFVATVLHAIETVSFLSVVTCFRTSLQPYSQMGRDDMMAEFDL